MTQHRIKTAAVRELLLSSLLALSESGKVERVKFTGTGLWYYQDDFFAALFN